MTSARSNRPSHVRVAEPPVLRLMPRDRAILLSIYRYRVLTSHQIEALHFPSQREGTRSRRSACQRRLQLLFHHRYVARILAPLVMGEGRTPYAYALDARGADEVAAASGLDRSQIGWRPKDNKLGPLFLDHLLAISRLRVVTELLVACGAWAAVQWWDERAFLSGPLREKTPYRFGAGGRSRRVPDGYLRVNVPQREQTAHFFVEVDQGTMTNTRWADKMRAYRDFRTLGRSQHHFGTANFRVLTLVSSPGRLANLKRTTEKVGVTGHYWFALQDDLDIWQPQRALEPIWQVAGSDGRHALF